MIAFKDIIQIEDNTLMIVDALNLAFRWKSRLSKDENEPINQPDFATEYLNTIQSLKSSYKCKKVILALDGGYSYRKEIYPEYKQNRKGKYNERERLLFNEFIARFNDAIEHIKNTTIFKVIKLTGVEADDIAAHICNNLNEYNLKHVWLISSDKDWLQLISEYVSKFSFVTREEITHNNWYDHYDFDVSDYISLKCLHGDKGDNIPGIPGIGEIRAHNLIKEYGNALTIYNKLPIKGTSKYIKNLNESGDTILRNYKLMDLVQYADDAIEPHLNDLKQILKEYL